MTRSDPAAPGARLVARTRRLDADVDLLDVAGPAGLLFEQAGTGIAGRGTALRIELPVGHDRLRRSAGVVDTALAAVEVDDEIGRPGTGPVAFVALPFGDDDAGGVAVVPSLLVGRDADGTRWVTTVEDADGGATNHPTLVADLTATDPTVPAGMGPGSFEVRASRTPAAWCEAVAEAVATLRRGELGKVVLARQVVVEADAPLDVLGLLRRMRTSYPSAMVFAIDGFVGASPELLVSRTGDIVRSHPMAGTVPRTGDPEADGRLAAELLASSKDRAEHQVTIDVVLDTVLPFCSYVDSEPEPRVVSLANVAHLASLVEGRLSSPPATALTLAAALHPTPAVCGWPRDDARREIARLEGEPRGRYTGAVGWTDARGDGRLAVAIRCAEVDGARATVYAGNGIVAGSDPATELAETRAKLQAVLGSLVQP